MIMLKSRIFAVSFLCSLTCSLLLSSIHNVEYFSFKSVQELVTRSETQKRNITVTVLPTDRDHDRPFIAYEIVAKHEVNYDEFNQTCAAGPFRNKYGRNRQIRAPTHPTIKAMTNFSTKMSLENLRLLVMGDSVAMQIFHMIDMALGGSEQRLTAVEYTHWIFYSAALSSTGKVGAWRMTNMFLRANQGKPRPNAPGGGWNATIARTLLALPDPNTGKPIESFDAILFQIPIGWMNLKKFTISDLIESLRLANEVFGVKKAIVLTMSFINNFEFDMIPMLLEKNQEILSFSKSFQRNQTIPGIEDLVVMDYADLTFHFIRSNAKLLGYLNDTDSSKMTYLNVRVQDFDSRIHPAVAHVCGGPIYTEKSNPNRHIVLCEKNTITKDGMHMCENAYGGHMVAATGCLLQCLYPVYPENTAVDQSLSCQKACNRKFMTLGVVNSSSGL